MDDSIPRPIYGMNKIIASKEPERASNRPSSLSKSSRCGEKTLPLRILSDSILFDCSCRRAREDWPIALDQDDVVSYKISRMSTCAQISLAELDIDKGFHPLYTFKDFVHVILGGLPFALLQQ